jgi:hypothetical protein
MVWIRNTVSGVVVILGLSDVLRRHFLRRRHRQILKTWSDSLLPGDYKTDFDFSNPDPDPKSRFGSGFVSDFILKRCSKIYRSDISTEPTNKQKQNKEFILFTC